MLKQDNSSNEDDSEFKTKLKCVENLHDTVRQLRISHM